MNGETQRDTAESPNAKPITIATLCGMLSDLVKSMRQSNSHLHSRINELELRVYRYDKMFEKAFEEEVAKRLSRNKDGEGKMNACGIDPLYHIEKRLEGEQKRGL